MNTKLDDQISQNRKELERRPPGNIGRAQALYNLAESVRKRSKKTNAGADIDEAIALHRQALDLRPTGHPDRHWSLYWLAWCLHDRYQKQRTLPDLEESITLGRAALDPVQRVIQVDRTPSMASQFVYATGTSNVIP